jgi:hypothetical protein
MHPFWFLFLAPNHGRMQAKLAREKVLSNLDIHVVTADGIIVVLGLRIPPELSNCTIASIDHGLS